MCCMGEKAIKKEQIAETKAEDKLHYVRNPEVNLNLANDYKIIANDCELSGEFAGKISAIITKMLDGEPLQKEFMNNYKLSFYLSAAESKSIANVIDVAYPIDVSSVEKGDEFVVLVNRDMLTKLETEDEMAFVLGHEISHIMYQKGFVPVKDLSTNEEVACDLNSILLTDSGGYNLLEITKIDDLYPKKSAEMQKRIYCREQFIQNQRINKYRRLGLSRSWNTNAYVQLSHKEWCFDIDGLGDKSKEEQVGAIVDILRIVYKRGGRQKVKDGLNDFFNTKSLKEASGLVVMIAEQLVKKFKPIDEAKNNDEYRTYLNHPINVFSEVVAKQFAREGAKQLPPEAMVAIRKYAQQNPKTFNKKDFCWSAMLNYNQASGALFIKTGR